MRTRQREVTLTLAWKEWQTAKNWGFYIRGSDRKYAYHITTDPPSFFHSCVSFLGENRAGALQKASKRLQSSQLGRSQHALHISSKKNAKKTMHGELLKKNTGKNQVSSKIADFCMEDILLANSLRIKRKSTKLAPCREQTRAIMTKAR